MACLISLWIFNFIMLNHEIKGCNLGEIKFIFVVIIIETSSVLFIKVYVGTVSKIKDPELYVLPPCSHKMVAGKHFSC